MGRRRVRARRPPGEPDPVERGDGQDVGVLRCLQRQVQPPVDALHRDTVSPTPPATGAPRAVSTRRRAPPVSWKTTSQNRAQSAPTRGCVARSQRAGGRRGGMYRRTTSRTRCHRPAGPAAQGRAALRRRGHREMGISMMPKTLPEGSVTVATRMPPPTSCTSSWRRAPSLHEPGERFVRVRHAPVGHHRGSRILGSWCPSAGARLSYPATLNPT